MKRVWIILITVLCVGIVGCNSRDNSSEEDSSKEETKLTLEECFNSMEKMIENGDYQLKIKDYAVFIENGEIGEFIVDKDKEDFFIGCILDDEYSYVMKDNNQEEVCELFSATKNSSIGYSYVNYDRLEGEYYGYFGEQSGYVCRNLINISNKDLNSMVKYGMERNEANHIVPSYDSLKKCILKIEEDSGFVIERNDKDGYRIVVALKDFLKWCDTEDGEYNISSQTLLLIDSFTDDSVLEIDFKLDGENVNGFNLIISNKTNEEKKGFEWKFSELKDNPKEIYDGIISDIKPGDSKLAMERLVNDLTEMHMKASPDSKVFFGIKEENMSYVVKEIYSDVNTAYMNEYYYNGYDYNKDENTDEVDIDITDVSFYDCDNIKKCIKGESVKGMEVSEWKIALLKKLMDSYDVNNTNGCLIDAKDDAYPEYVVDAEGEFVSIISYNDGTVNSTYDIYSMDSVSNKKCVITSKYISGIFTYHCGNDRKVYNVYEYGKELEDYYDDNILPNGYYVTYSYILVRANSDNVNNCLVFDDGQYYDVLLYYEYPTRNELYNRIDYHSSYAGVLEDIELMIFSDMEITDVSTSKLSKAIYEMFQYEQGL